MGEVVECIKKYVVIDNMQRVYAKLVSNVAVKVDGISLNVYRGTTVDSRPAAVVLDSETDCNSDQEKLFSDWDAHDKSLIFSDLQQPKERNGHGVRVLVERKVFGIDRRERFINAIAGSTGSRASDSCVARSARNFITNFRP